MAFLIKKNKIDEPSNRNSFILSSTLIAFFLLILINISSFLTFSDKVVFVEDVVYVSSDSRWSCGKNSSDVFCLNILKQHILNCGLYEKKKNKVNKIYWLESEGLFFPSTNVTSLEKKLTSCGLIVLGSIKSVNSIKPLANLLIMSLLFLTIILIPFYFQRK
jgi:hypothetical protein